MSQLWNEEAIESISLCGVYTSMPLLQQRFDKSGTVVIIYPQAKTTAAGFENFCWWKISRCLLQAIVSGKWLFKIFSVYVQIHVHLHTDTGTYMPQVRNSYIFIHNSAIMKPLAPFLANGKNHCLCTPLTFKRLYCDIFWIDFNNPVLSM